MTDLEELEQQAIEEAIKNNWQKAIKLNQKILKVDELNLDAHLRLGFAYLQINDLAKSKKHYNQALKIQPSHQIANQYINKIRVLENHLLTDKKINNSISKDIQLDPKLFLDVAGKTKSLSLVNLGQKKVLAQLTVGQKVALNVKKRKIEIRTKNGHYIGSFPDDLSKRLILFIKARSKYSVYIKETGINNVVVFIKEEKKGRKMKNYLSFPTDIKTNLTKMTEDYEETADDHSQDELEIEKLAKELTEEKDYLPFQPEDEEEEE